MKARLPWILVAPRSSPQRVTATTRASGYPPLRRRGLALRPQHRPRRPRHRLRPRPLNPADYIPIEIGEVVQRTIEGDPPACLGEPQWPCQHFRFTPASDGTVTVVLTYIPDTQPPGRGGPQGVDISIGGAWAEYGDRTTTRLTTAVLGGREYPITLWSRIADWPMSSERRWRRDETVA